MKLTSSGCVPIMKLTIPTPPPQGCVCTTESIVCAQVSQNPVCAAESILCAQVRRLPVKWGDSLDFHQMQLHSMLSLPLTVCVNDLHSKQHKQPVTLFSASAFCTLSTWWLPEFKRISCRRRGTCFSKMCWYWLNLVCLEKSAFHLHWAKLDGKKHQIQNFKLRSQLEG